MSGTASVTYDSSPSGLRPYLDNYETSITEVLGTPTTLRPDGHGGRGAPGSTLAYTGAPTVDMSGSPTARS